MHNSDPFDYLRDVLGRINATPISNLVELLPHDSKTAQAVQAISI